MKFKELKEADKLRTWSIIDLSETARLYYSPNENNNGFQFASIVKQLHHENEEWNDETEVEVLIQGVAYFDGVRHLWLGSEQTDNVGYFYYPNLEDCAKVFQALSELETKHCSDFI